MVKEAVTWISEIHKARKKGFIERKQQRDQQQLMQPQQQHSELIELPASRQSALEQQQLQQPSDEKVTKITTSDNELA